MTGLQELWLCEGTEQLLFQNKGPDACAIHALSLIHIFIILVKVIFVAGQMVSERRCVPVSYTHLAVSR